MKECELRRAEFEIEIGVAELEGSLLMISDLPNCAPDGRYAPIQTNFDKKFCAEPEFGDQLENFSVAKISPEAEVMNCRKFNGDILIFCEIRKKALFMFYQTVPEQGIS
jgi:hypothetical protein